MGKEDVAVPENEWRAVDFGRNEKKYGQVSWPYFFGVMPLYFLKVLIK